MRKYKNRSGSFSASPQKHSRFLLALSVWTYLCNLFDLGYTVLILNLSGRAYELNPFVSALLDTPLLAVLYKNIVPAAAIALMYANRRLPLARAGLFICAAAYTAVTLYHILSAIAVL